MTEYPVPLRATSPRASLEGFSSLFPPYPSARTVFTFTGASVDLPALVSELAAERPVLIGWVRHFGCTLCARVAAAWKGSRALKETGAKIVLVGCGSVEHLRGFMQKSGWDGREERLLILTDPQCGTYGALRWKKGFRSTFNLSSLREVIRSFWEGNSQTWRWWPKDPLQQGGLVVVGKGGHVLWNRAERFAGDLVQMKKLVEKLSEKPQGLRKEPYVRERAHLSRFVAQRKKLMSRVLNCKRDCRKRFHGKSSASSRRTILHGFVNS